MSYKSGNEFSDSASLGSNPSSPATKNPAKQGSFDRGQGGQGGLEGEPAPHTNRHSGRVVIVCGGRQYQDRDTLNRTLDRIHALNPIGLLVQGGASGADGMAAQWATARGVPFRSVEAKWQAYGRRAGPMRNQEIADAGADLCVAFPGGRGTADMKRRAEAAGIPVVAISPPLEVRA